MMKKLTLTLMLLTLPLMAVEGGGTSEGGGTTVPLIVQLQTADRVILEYRYGDAEKESRLLVFQSGKTLRLERTAQFGAPTAHFGQLARLEFDLLAESIVRVAKAPVRGGFESKAKPAGSTGKGELVIYPTAADGRTVRAVLDDEIWYLELDSAKWLERFAASFVDQDMPL